MDGSIVLGAGQRRRLLEIYRGKEASPADVRLRAHIVLLLAEGQPWSLIAAVLFCSTATIARWKSRFDAGGIDALLEEKRGRRAVLVLSINLLVTWVTGSCAAGFWLLPKPLVLWKEHHVKLSVETVRRYLYRYLWQFDFVWNTRQLNDGERTIAAIKSSEGKRLMYKQPTAG